MIPRARPVNARSPYRGEIVGWSRRGHRAPSEGCVRAAHATRPVSPGAASRSRKAIIDPGRVSTWRIAGPEFGAEVGLVPAAEFVADRAEMKPGPRLGRRRERSRRNRCEGEITVQAARLVGWKGFAVTLVDAAEAAKFALGTVPVAVVVVILGRELAARNLVDRLDARHNLNRKRQRRVPLGREFLLIAQVERSRRRIGDAGERADVIVHLVDEVRLGRPGEIEKEHARARKRRDVGAPQHAGGSDAEEIDQAYGVDIGDGRCALDHDGIAPGIAALIDPQGDPAILDIDDVGETIAIHVADEDALRIVAKGQSRSVGHVDPLAPIAVTEVWPIIDAAGMHERDILQAVAREIGPFDARVG